MSLDEMAADWRGAADSVFDEVVTLRRAIHADPEIGLQCPRTSARIKAALAGLPLEFREGTSTTGFVAILRGGGIDRTGGNGRTVLLRGDMDALPMQEETGLPFASKVGVSRKIDERSERQRLRQMVGEILPDDVGGVIVRTVSEDATQETFKRELDTLPGRITLGVLVLQDIFAILFLAVQPSLDNLQISVILISIGRVGVLVATALVLSRYVLPWLFHHIARRP